MNEKNRSMKFLIWQTEKLAIIAAVAPIIYVFLLNIMEGEFSLVKGIGAFLPYVYLMFAIVVLISYGFSLSKVVLPLAVAMGSTRKEAVLASAFANIFLVAQVYLLYVVSDLIVYGNFLERIKLTVVVLGLLILVSALQNAIVAFMMNTNSQYIAIIITIIMCLSCGFAAGIFAAFMDDMEISITFYVEWWMGICGIIVSISLYIMSVYYMLRKMRKYRVQM